MKWCHPLWKGKGTLLKVLKIFNNPFLPGVHFESLSYVPSPDNLIRFSCGYWGRELGRLIYPLPEMETVIHELRRHLESLVKPAYAGARNT